MTDISSRVTATHQSTLAPPLSITKLKQRNWTRVCKITLRSKPQTELLNVLCDLDRTSVGIFLKAFSEIYLLVQLTWIGKIVEMNGTYFSFFFFFFKFVVVSWFWWTSRPFILHHPLFSKLFFCINKVVPEKNKVQYPNTRTITRNRTLFRHLKASAQNGFSDERKIRMHLSIVFNYDNV